MLRRILNIIGWIGAALVIAAVATRFLKPEWSRYAMYLAWTGLLFVVLYPIVQWREIASDFGRRQTRYAAIASTSVIVAIGILIAANYLSNRRSERWDLTKNSVNSLSEQSIKVLSDLKDPLKLILIDRSVDFDQYRPRLSMYDYTSDKVSVEYLDGEADPIRAKQYGIQTVPTLVIDYKGHTENVTTLEEREITSAIIRAVTGQARKVYFVQGHGEKDPASNEPGGYAGVAGLLKGDNITVEPLVLTQHKAVPDDATLVAIVGPTTDPLDEEMDELRQYLDKGGKLLLMLDPAIGERAKPVTKLTELARSWGIEVGNDVILDVSGRSNSPTFAVASPPYPSHPITAGFASSTVFPIARSVSVISPAPAGKTVQPLVQTSQAAWAETDLAGLQRPGAQPEMNTDKGDKAGPVGIAATVSTSAPPPPEGDKADASKTPPQTRIAVFGDSDFASNAIGNSVGNADLLLNTVNWLTAQENLISIRPREPGDSRLNITPSQMYTVWVFSIFGVPAVVAVAGIFAWWRRRKV